jgi:hypothetical protein
MEAFSDYLSGRKEQNCSLAIDRYTRKLGGNMPICANALANLGVPVICVGAMGIDVPEPVFAAINPLCSLYPVAMPGECLALEFQKSKLFLADSSGPRSMTWAGILDAIGLEACIKFANRAQLFGLFNWGELLNMQQIWEGFARDVLPRLDGEPRTVVFDLSDCSSRSDDNILAVLEIMSEFRKYVQVVLSVNDNEIRAISQTVGKGHRDQQDMGYAIIATCAMDLLVHHGIGYARTFDAHGNKIVIGKLVDKPAIITGGGDHFNAGLILGLLAGLTVDDSARVGNTVSKSYVSSGYSPSLIEVIGELMKDISEIEENI